MIDKSILKAIDSIYAERHATFQLGYFMGVPFAEFDKDALLKLLFIIYQDFKKSQEELEEARKKRFQ